MTRADAHGLRGLFQRVEKPRLSSLLSGWPRHVTPSVRSVPAADFPPTFSSARGSARRPRGCSTSTGQRGRLLCRLLSPAGDNRLDDR